MNEKDHELARDSLQQKFRKINLKSFQNKLFSWFRTFSGTTPSYARRLMITGEWSEYDLIVEVASFQSLISAIILVTMEFSQHQGIMFDNLISQLMCCFDNFDELLNCVEDLYLSILCAINI